MQLFRQVFASVFDCSGKFRNPIQRQAAYWTRNPKCTDQLIVDIIDWDRNTARTILEFFIVSRVSLTPDLFQLKLQHFRI